MYSVLIYMFDLFKLLETLEKLNECKKYYRNFKNLQLTYKSIQIKSKNGQLNKWNINLFSNTINFYLETLDLFSVIENTKKDYEKQLNDCRKTYKRVSKVNKDYKLSISKKTKDKQLFNENIKNICKTVLNNKRNNLNPFLSETEVKRFIDNFNDYHVIKLSETTLESLKLGFICYKSNYEYEYNKSFKQTVLLKTVNIEFKGLKYKCIVVSVLLTDGFLSFLVFRDYNVFFKQYIYDMIVLGRKKESEVFYELTEFEERVLLDLNSNKRFFYDTSETIDYYTLKIEKHNKKLSEVSKKLNNSEKHLKLLENDLKHYKNLMNDKQRVRVKNKIIKTKKDIETLNDWYMIFLNNLNYYSEELERLLNEDDDFKSSNNYRETVFEDMEGFEYSFKEKKVLGLLD